MKHPTYKVVQVSIRVLAIDQENVTQVISAYNTDRVIAHNANVEKEVQADIYTGIGKVELDLRKIFPAPLK